MGNLQLLINSPGGQRAVLDSDRYERVSDLKSDLIKNYGLYAHCSIFWGLYQLQDDEIVSQLFEDVVDAVSLDVHVDLLGGGKKRKKKQHTTPKKIKHKKKKVKLAVLKFYKVDGNDKVTRLLKDCPAESCGRGVFMAQHHNRTYCGRCGLTYTLNN